MPETPKRTIRADEQTWGRARRLAHATGETGVSVSEWIRDAINRAWSDFGLEPMDTQENDR